MSVTDIEKAVELHKSGKLTEAEELYKKTLTAYPNDFNALNLLGFLNIQLNKYAEAISLLQKATVTKPDFFDAWFNLGLAYKKSNLLDDAIDAYSKAIAINPKNSLAYFNTASAYDNKNDTLNAAKYYKLSCNYNSAENNAENFYALGISLLKLKDFEDGLKYFESRLSKDFAILTQMKEYRKILTYKPLWKGETLNNKTIFVYFEAGLGDVIMYYRYISLLKNTGAKILFKPQWCFTDLFKENNLGAEIIDHKFDLNSANFDYHIPMMSIPYLLNQFTENAPLSEGYIIANPEKIQQYKNKYFDTDKIKIGVKWKGNTAYDIQRVIKSEYFYKLFDIQGIQFYSLQKGEGIEELDSIPAKYNVINLGETFNDFSDTAAAINNLDLVICNDTSVGHLAGSMGKKCWLLLPFVQNWRWYTDTNYSPWYKSVKLFKQNSPDNWQEVFESVYNQLNAYCSSFTE